MTTQYGPGDPETWSRQPDDYTVEQPAKPLTNEEFVAKIWEVLANSSPAIDKFILAYLDKPNIGYHNWSSAIREIADAVDEAMYGKAS